MTCGWCLSHLHSHESVANAKGTSGGHPQRRERPLRHVPGSHPSWVGPVSCLLSNSSQKGTCLGWVTSPAFQFGKYGSSRHVESAFYCFLLVEHKHRTACTTQGNEGSQGHRALSSVQRRKPGRLEQGCILATGARNRRNKWGQERREQRQKPCF